MHADRAEVLFLEAIVHELAHKAGLADSEVPSRQTFLLIVIAQLQARSYITFQVAGRRSPVAACGLWLAPFLRASYRRHSPSRDRRAGIDPLGRHPADYFGACRHQTYAIPVTRDGQDLDLFLAIHHWAKPRGVFRRAFV